MPRKKRRMFIIGATIILILIITIVMLLLYINTDMFKSNSALFTQYIGQSVEKIATLYNEAGTSEYEKILKQNKCTTQTQVKVNFTENIGTSSESTQNSINQLKLQIDGQTDNSNQYNYQDIRLLNSDEKVAEIEYIQSENTYGIRFSDLFNQYILADNENLKKLFKKVGYTEDELVNIPDTVEFDYDVKSIFQFSEEEKESIKTKCINLFKYSISKDNFSKQHNQGIQIDGQNINTNSYVLTLTKEQLNNIYINLLEEAKQDEIILTKIDKIQTLLEQYQFSEMIDLRGQFVEEIEDLITNITKNNIGQEEVKIIVYVNNRTAVRTIIQHPDYNICIDLLSSSEEEKLQITYQDTTSQKEQVFTYKKGKEETSVIFDNEKEEKTTQYSLVVDEKINDNNCVKNIVVKYEDNTNRLETTIKQTINIVDGFENEVVLNDENAINLSELEEEEVQIVLDKVNNGISKKVNAITTTINTEDLWNALKAVGLIKEEMILETMGITDTEKSRFNSRFEILQGENLESDAILNLIEAIKSNLIDLEVVSNTELKLKLDRLNKNEEVANTLSTFIEKNKNKKYNAKVEYDATTGLVSNIILTMLET